MSNQTFGKLAWNQPLAKGNLGESDFLGGIKTDGQFNYRIIGTEPYQFAIHWKQDSNGQNRRLRCALRDCVLCKEGVEVKKMFALEVYSYEENRAGILEVGPQIYNAIHGLANNPKWGDPRQYDIMIDRKKSRGPSGMYQVIPSSKEAATEQVRTAARTFLDKKVNLDKVLGPMTNDQILQKLGRTPGGPSSFNRTAVDSVVSDPSTQSDNWDDVSF